MADNGIDKQLSKLEQKQAAYVDARLDGNSRETSCEIAGFSPDSRTLVERTAKSKIIAELDKRGLDESGLADKYTHGLKKVESGDESFDGQAYAKLLLQVGYLRGHGRESPTVAIQNNFGAAHAPGNEPVATGELLREVADGLRAIREEISRRNAAGVPEPCFDVAGGSEVLAEPEARPGMVPPGGDGEQALGGGQP